MELFLSVMYPINLIKGKLSILEILSLKNQVEVQRNQQEGSVTYQKILKPKKVISFVQISVPHSD